MLALQIERLKRAQSIDRLLVATSTENSDDPLELLCRENNIECYRGSLNNVLERFFKAAEPHLPDYVVRLTGDCPLADPKLLDEIVRFCIDGKYDYASNAIKPTFPDGLDVEVMRFSALKKAWLEATLITEKEHVTPFIRNHAEHFRLGSFTQEIDLSSMRWTVDEPQDFEFVRKIYEALYRVNPAFTTAEVINYLKNNPEVSALNQSLERNEGYSMSLRKDFFAKRYKHSQELLARALKSIPLGAQTFSKSKTQYPYGVSPYFIKKGAGCRVWDVDGNEYRDFNNSLCSVNLGYNDPDVTAAVKAQLEDGIIFTLSHPIETQVAEKIIEMVPCAEMVRFGKNGSDATAGAIRLARAHTGRDHVLVCGYHGWQDWYIGSTARNLGVPKATRDLTHSFVYNDIESLHKLFAQYPDQVAAVILEPMNVQEPQKGFLEAVKELTHSKGALLVFDETITGFRFANGGAQELFGVTPDLATFGKGLANGYPVSAVAGRADVMKLMEEIFFSFTFGGETLSLAAALATMTKIQSKPVIKTMAQHGTNLIAGVQRLIQKHKLEDIVSVSGNPTWSFLLFKDVGKYSQWEIKTLFMQEIFAKGFLTYGTHNISYAHTSDDVAKLLEAYEEIFPMIKDGVSQNSLEKLLYCKPLVPLFKVR